MNTNEQTSLKPLRLWPGVAAAVLLILVRFVIPIAAPKAEFFGMDVPLLAIFGGLVGALLIVLWWVFFSRAPWSERLGAIVVMIVAVVVDPAPHPHLDSERDDGQDVLRYCRPANREPRARRLGGRQPPPVSRSPALGDGRRYPARLRSVVARPHQWHSRRRSGARVAVDPTAEERLLAQARDEPAAPPSAPAAPATPPERPVVKVGEDPARPGPLSVACSSHHTWE